MAGMGHAASKMFMSLLPEMLHEFIVDYPTIQLLIGWAIVAAPFAAAIALYIFIKMLPRIRQWLMSALLPGPFGIPFIGSLLKMRNGQKQFMDWLKSEAAHLRSMGIDMMTVNFGGRIPIVESTVEITKGGARAAFEKPWIGGGLMLSDGDKWKTQRRQLTPTFSDLDRHVALMNKHSKILLDVIEERRSSRDFKIYELVRLATADVICEAAMGKDIDAQHHPDQPFIRALRDFSAMEQRYATDPTMWIPPVWSFLHAKKYNAILKQLRGFTAQVIAERMHSIDTGSVHFGDGEGKTKKIFLDHLLEMRDDEGFSFDEIREHVDTFIFAGHDSTASAIGWALWCLATNGDCQQKAFEEIRSVFGNSDRVCSLEDIKRLEYLERCIKESMRLWPTVPIVDRHLQEDLISGHFTLPKGSEVFISPMIIHSNSKIYKDVNVFNPERFSPDAVARRHPYDYIPFSAGPRNCIGQKFALTETLVTVSWILRWYALRSDKPMRDIEESPELVMQPANDFPIVFTPRK